MSEDRHSGLPGGNGSGANIKAGETGPITCGGSTLLVTFNTAFASIPEVVAVISEARSAVDLVRVTSRTVNDFRIQIYKGHGGSTHDSLVNWIATDAGDP